MDKKNTYNSDYYLSEENENDEENKSEIVEETDKNNKIITIGICSRFYLYILGIGLLKLISSLILGKRSQKEEDDGIGIFGFCPIFQKYNFIQSIYIYIGYIILGFFFFYFKNVERKEIGEINGKSKLSEIEKALTNYYIYNKPIDNIQRNIEFKDYFLFIGFALHIETKKILYIEGFRLFHYWTCEIIIMQFLMGKYFKIYFYKHHKMTIILNPIFGTLILITASFLPSSISENDKNNSYQNVEEKLGSYYYIILLILLFMILSFVFCFTRIYSKVLMQIKYISPYKLVFLFGFAGLVISISASIIAYYIDYRDNIINYFSSMRVVLDKGKKYRFYGEIFLVSPMYSFSNALEFIFEIITIYYLNPFYVLLSNTLYYSVSEFITFMLQLSNVGLVILHFILTELAEFLISFWLMVYLEIIELNFCGLSDNVKKNIIKKGENEFKLLSLSSGNLDEENDEGGD